MMTQNTHISNSKFTDFVHLVKKARVFATEAHKGVYRKGKDDNGERLEYITHPIAVSRILHTYKKSHKIDVLVAACMLHDTVEDTVATMESIEGFFGPEIAKGVWFMTKTPDYVGNRKFRKELCEMRLREAPEIIRILKTCDMFHNSLSIEEHDPKFWKTFKEETVSLLIAMNTLEVMGELEVLNAK